MGAPLTWTGLSDFVLEDDRLKKSSSVNSWSSSANSTSSISADGGLSFLAVNNASYMVGLSAEEQGVGFNTIDYAMYLAQGNVFVYENGFYKGSFVTYQGNELFSISRSGNTITYSKDGVSFYTSTVSSSGDLIADVSMHTGDKLMPRIVFTDCITPSTIPVLTKVRAVKNTEEDMFAIYPNPSHGEFTVRFKSVLSSNTDVHVFDATGREINVTLLQKGGREYSIDISKQPKGIYLVRFSQDGVVYSRNIVVQ